MSEDTFSDHASNGKGRKTAIASPKVSWGLKVIYKDLEDITRWREDMNFIFEWQTTRVPDVVFMNFTSGIFSGKTLVSI